MGLSAVFTNKAKNKSIKGSNWLENAFVNVFNFCSGLITGLFKNMRKSRLSLRTANNVSLFALTTSNDWRSRAKSNRAFA